MTISKTFSANEKQIIFLEHNNIIFRLFFNKQRQRIKEKRPESIRL